MNYRRYMNLENAEIATGSIPHPIINSIIGNTVPYNENIINAVSTSSEYDIGVGYLKEKNKLYLGARRPEELRTLNLEEKIEVRDTVLNRIAIDDIIEEQNNITEKEYMYTVDLGKEMPEDASVGPQHAAFYKAVNNPLLDFVEYKYKIPLFINKNESEFLKNGIPRNADGIKLFGLDMEFDNVFPEAVLKVPEDFRKYYYTPTFTYLHKARILPDTMQNSVMDASWFKDRAKSVPAAYQLMNGFSGRHCKYQMTAVKSKKRNKVLIHQDMIYDSLCHSSTNLHKVMGYNDWLKFMCGGVLRRISIAPVIPSTYYGKTAGYHSAPAFIYPLPLNVQFELTYSDDPSSNIEIFKGSSYVKIGDIVVRTYKGIRHFQSPNYRTLRDENITSTNFGAMINGDLYVNHLRAFTIKINIPRNIPSLLVRSNNESHYVEVYSIPTTWQTSSEKLDILNFKDRSNINITNSSIRPNFMVSAEYRAHIDDKYNEAANVITDEAFMRHIEELGGLNGFLLPPERRVVDYPIQDTGRKVYENYMYENLSFKTIPE